MPSARSWLRTCCRQFVFMNADNGAADNSNLATKHTASIFALAKSNVPFASDSLVMRYVLSAAVE